MKRLRVNVRGRVQGVSFRYYTLSEAQRLDLTGWVRNESDGSVTVVAEGAESDLGELLEFLHRGPRAARVDDLSLNWSSPNQEFGSFGIRW